jgi:hypothetical protein
VESGAEAFDDGQVLDDEFDEHSGQL